MIFGITYGLSSPLIALELSNRGHGEFVIGLNAAMQAPVERFLTAQGTEHGFDGKAFVDRFRIKDQAAP